MLSKNIIKKSPIWYFSRIINYHQEQLKPANMPPNINIQKLQGICIHDLSQQIVQQHGLIISSSDVFIQYIYILFQKPQSIEKYLKTQTQTQINFNVLHTFEYINKAKATSKDYLIRI